MEAIMNFIQATGFYQIATGDWKVLIMLLISFVLLYLAIVKKFEPLLLLPIAFGMLITNLPGAEMYHEMLFAGGHVNWEIFGGQPITAEFLAHLKELGVSDAVLGTVQVGQTISVGLIDVLYLGVKLGIYPCLIFIGVGASTDFGPLIANPKTLLLGAAAQVGIFMTFVGCKLSTLFTNAQAASIGIIGGLQLHGPGACHPAPHHAPAHHRRGAQDRDAPPARGLQAGEDHLPYHGNCVCGPAGALRRSADRVPDAWQPV